METLCGIGLPELIVVAMLGFVLIGPERSKDVALKAGRFLRSVITSRWWKEFNQVATSVRNLPNTLVRMAELEEAQADIERTMRDLRGSELTNTPITGQQSPERVYSDDPWGIENAVAQTQASRPADDPDLVETETSDTDTDTDADNAN